MSKTVPASSSALSIDRVDDRQAMLAQCGAAAAAAAVDAVNDCAGQQWSQ
jgi:hypothetical protein